jgi:hypothetical protein
MPPKKPASTGKSWNCPNSEDDQKTDAPPDSQMHVTDVHGIFNE